MSATLFISCGDDDDAPAFTLTNANIAGTYKFSSIETEEKETATGSSGTMVDISTSKGIAKTFDDVAFVFNANGSYTASGKFVFEKTITPNGGSPTKDDEIIVFNASGTYVINTLNSTITFNQTTGDFIDEQFKVVTFSQKNITITQSDVDVDGPITTTNKLSIGLVRQ